MSKWEWQDITPYSRDEPDRAPTTWLYGSITLPVKITRGHSRYPGEWVVSVDQVLNRRIIISTVALRDITGAQARAIELVRSILEEYLAEL